MARTLETSVEISGVLSPSLQQAIRNAVSQLEQMSEETLEAAGAAERLAAEISTEETVLENLERGYADFIVSGEESTEEARALAEQIQRLSRELDENRDTLEDAERAARDLADAQDDTSDAYESLQRTISRQEDELEALQREYARLVLEQGEGSRESRELARQISQLSGELNENRQRLDDAERAADRLGGALDEADDSARHAEEGFTVLKGVLSDLASEALQAAADGIKDFAGNVVELGMNFTSTMSEVQAISGATGEELETLEACAREYGATTTFSASEAAEALKYMALAGWDVEQSTSALGGVLNLAAASGMELGAASDMVTDYLSAFKMGADEAAYFADVLAYAQSHSNTSAEELGEAYKNCAANLNAAGQDVETVTSMLEAMANQGLHGSEAGTALAATMRDITAKMTKATEQEELALYAKNGLVSITGDLNDVFQTYAITVGETLIPVADAQGDFRDLTDIMIDVEKAAGGMGDAERAAALSSTFTADSIKGMNLILNEGMTSIFGYEQSLCGAGISAGGFADAAEELGMDLDAVKKAFEEAGVSAEAFDFCVEMAWGYDSSAESLIDGLTEVSADGNAREVFESLGITMEELQAVLDSSAGTAEQMAAVMNDNLAGDLAQMNSAWEELQLKIYEHLEGPLRSAVQFVTNSVIPAVEGLMGHLPELGAALAGIGAALAALKWDSITKKLSLAKGAVKGIIGAVGGISGPVMAAAAVIGILVSGFLDLWKTNEDFRDKVTGIWEELKESFGEIGGEIGRMIKELMPLIQDTAGTVISILIQAAETILPVLAELAGAVLPVIMELIKQILPVIMAAVQAVLPLLSEVLALLGPILDIVVALLEPVISLIRDALAPLAEFLMLMISDVLQVLIPVLSVLAEVFVGVLGAAIEYVQPVVESIASVFQGLIDFITGVFTADWTKAWDGIVQIFSGIWSGIITFVKTPVNAVIALINGAIRGLNKISVDIPDWVPLVGGSHFGLDIPEIPLLASGGFTDGVSIAGEAGMEAVISFDPRYHSDNVAVWEEAGRMLGVIDDTAASGGLDSISTDMPDQIPEADDIRFEMELPDINLPDIPMYTVDSYAGDVPDADGAGMEAAVSFEAAYHSESAAVWQDAGQQTGSTGGMTDGSDAGLISKAGELLALDDFSLGSLADSGGAAVYYDFSGFTWSPQIQAESAEQGNDFMAQLKAHEAEFFDWLEEFIQMREAAGYA